MTNFGPENFEPAKVLAQHQGGSSPVRFIGGVSMLKPIALSRAHAETSSVAESLPVLTDLLGFERVPDSGPTLLRHPASEWELVLNERAGAPLKAHHDH